MNFYTMSVIGLFWLVASCNNNDFAGGSAGRQNRDATANKQTPHPEDSPSVKGPNLGKPSKDDPISTDPTPQPNTRPEEEGSKATPSLSDLIDMLGSKLKVNDDVATDQPNENEIVFGGNRVFHIGDNNFSASTCKSQIVPYSISGTKYYFEFEVKKDNTDVSIVIEKVCGVDHGDSNFLSLMSGTTTLESIPIGRGATSLNFSSKSPLAVGKYVLLVESRGGSQEPGRPPNDHDDFIVGKVQIKASGPIKPGKVGAQN